MFDRSSVVELSEKKTDIHEHLLTLYGLVLGLNAQVVVELGAGQSTYALCAGVNATGGHLWSIDLYQTALVQGGPPKGSDLSKEPNFTFLHTDDIGAAIGWDRKIDLLFIDTSHEYEHTKKELNTWLKFVKVGGKIAMHDTIMASVQNQGCRIALDEFLKERGGQYEAVHYDNCNGLSILTKLKED